MSRPLVSVICASYQRAHLLTRSLVCYENQDFDNSRFELVVVDDHSGDGTRELVLDWSATTKIAATVITAAPKPAEWVDCGWVLNAGIRASRGEHVLLTHPEVMVGRRSVAACMEQLDQYEADRKNYERHTAPGAGTPAVVSTNAGGTFGLYACCRVYYLSPREQELIDTCPWRGEGALAVRDISGFYELDTNGHPDYSHRATDKVAQPGSPYPRWESWVFGGCSRETWKRLGGMLETTQWGSVDVAFTHRRRTLGVPNHTCPHENTIVVHQNHNLPGDVHTDRDMAKWVAELKDYPLADRAKMCFPAVDNLGWGG